MTIYERIKHLRKDILNMTQDVFSEKIKISRSNLGSIETGRVNVTDRVIADICSVFSVNENWLRNGGSDDDILIKISIDEEVAMYTQMLLDSEDDIVSELIKSFIVTYYKLDDASKQLLKNTAKDWLNNAKNG